MARKEHKGGNLKNNDVERDLKVKGYTKDAGSNYHGSQDTGDSKRRDMGTEVQQRDGRPEEGANKENE